MDALGTLSPYRTEHINRFGNYVIDFDRMPEPSHWASLYRQSRRDSAICVFFTRILTALQSGNVTDDP